MWNRRLGRTADHRVALFRNMATDLILKGKIETTEMKAMELRSVVDHLITVAKKDDLAARRQAASYLRNVTTKDGKTAVPAGESIVFLGGGQPGFAETVSVKVSQ